MSAAASTYADAIVVGAGIIGASIAAELAKRGLRVRVFDAHLPAATAAGMGHLLILDANEDELAMSRYSLERWQQLVTQMPTSCAYSNNGTLWLAETEAEFEYARSKGEKLKQAGVDNELLSSTATVSREPMIGAKLHGSLRVPGDGIVYAPRVAAWLLEQQNLVVERRYISRVDENVVEDCEGNRFTARIIVVAAGLQASQLCPEIPLIAKKGHVAITDRVAHNITHTLVELGYVASAHNANGPSVASNIQPRPTGQLFLGATRQFDNTNSQVDGWMLGRLMRRVSHFVPALNSMRIIRSWAGFRAATPDDQPIIGAHPHLQGVWLALGHEGLGITAAPATADLLLAQLFAESEPFSSLPYDPARFIKTEACEARLS